jgi:chemotaxis response regulator CheB
VPIGSEGRQPPKTKVSVRTVLIADDYALIRQNIRQLLKTEPAIQIVGEAEDFGNAISMSRDLRPDVLPLDLPRPDDRILQPDFIKASLLALGSRTYILGIISRQRRGRRNLRPRQEPRRRPRLE